MILTKEQLGVIHFSMSADTQKGQSGNFNPRLFPVTDLKMVAELGDKLNKCVADNKFMDSEIELSTKEKSFVLKLIEREWTAADAPYILRLQELLS